VLCVYIDLCYCMCVCAPVSDAALTVVVKKQDGIDYSQRKGIIRFVFASGFLMTFTFMAFLVCVCMLCVCMLCVCVCAVCVLCVCVCV